ncbi:MAG: LapA family protein [Gammaproteobacteria bacterium]
MLQIIRLVFYILILLLGLSFAVLNGESISLNYYFGVWQAPLSLALVLVMALGVLLGVVACLGLLMRLKNEVSTLRKAAKLTEMEVMNLRAVPLKDAE